MSTLEYVIWHLLGYTAVPVIFLAGFIGVAGFSVWALSLTADKQK